MKKLLFILAMLLVIPAHAKDTTMVVVTDFYNMMCTPPATDSTGKATVLSDIAGYIIYKNGVPLTPKVTVTDVNCNYKADTTSIVGTDIYQAVTVDIYGQQSKLSTDRLLLSRPALPGEATNLR